MGFPMPPCGPGVGAVSVAGALPVARGHLVGTLRFRQAIPFSGPDKNLSCKGGLPCTKPESRSASPSSFFCVSAMLVAILAVVVGCTSEAPESAAESTPTPRAWPFADSDGEWIIDTEVDESTGEEKIAVWLLPRDHTTSSEEILVVRCGYDEGEDAEALVVFDDELEGNVFLEVQYSFDDGTIETEMWGLSNTKTALFARSPVEFIWRVMHAQELAIREETGQTLVFDVDGLANVLYPHREKCNWIGTLARSTSRSIPTPTPASQIEPSPRPTSTPVPTPTPASQVVTSGACSPVDFSEIDEFLRFYARGVACIEADRRQGSGFVVRNTDSGEGFLLTNAHVVGVDPTNVSVHLENVVYNAEVLKTSEERDLAMLSICCGDFVVLRRENRGVQFGEWVGALGFPGGKFADPSGVARTIVHDWLNTYLEHTADVQPGGSGGPLLAFPLTAIQRNQEGKDLELIDGETLGVLGLTSAKSTEYDYTTYTIFQWDLIAFVGGGW